MSKTNHSLLNLNRKEFKRCNKDYIYLVISSTSEYFI